METYQILLTEGSAKWTGHLFAAADETGTPDCLFMSDEFDRKGQAHQAVIDYCLLQGLNHQAMTIEIVRWEGC